MSEGSTEDCSHYKTPLRFKDKYGLEKTTALLCAIMITVIERSRKKGANLRNGRSPMSFKRILGISDIHGCFYLCIRLIESVIVFNPKEDQLIFLGDYIDFRSVTDAVDRRNVSSKMVVKYLTGLREKFPDNIVLIKGNHEAMAEKYFQTGDADALKMWTTNGGDETISSFGGIEQARRFLVPFIKELRLFYEVPQCIFVHGGIADCKPLYPQEEQETLRKIEYESRHKTLVIGHSVVDKLLRWENKIYTDLGAFTTGKLAAYDILNDQPYETATDEQAKRKARSR
jgi:serine/threonine protein phosphatase 1